MARLPCPLRAAVVVFAALVCGLQLLTPVDAAPRTSGESARESSLGGMSKKGKSRAKQTHRARKCRSRSARPAVRRGRKPGRRCRSPRRKRPPQRRAPRTPSPLRPAPAIPPAQPAPAPTSPPAEQSRAESPPAPGPTPAPAAPPVATPLPRFFARDSVWNAPLPDHAPIDPRSEELRAELERQLGIGAPWINTTYFSTPIYTVGPDQSRVQVILDTNYAPLRDAWLSVPVPPNARPAAGSDAHLVIHQPATDTMWEFWQFGWREGAWHARWGGRMDAVSESPGYFSGPLANWGATATSLPLVGGLITLDDLRAGRIDHALALAIPEARKGVWRWPAQRTDGSLDSAAAIPEGTRFRLDPDLDIPALRLPWAIRLMAEAAQRYGIVVRDQAGNVAFYGEDSAPTGSNPYSGPTGYFGGQYPNHLLERFPWHELEVVQAPEHR